MLDRKWSDSRKPPDNNHDDVTKKAARAYAVSKLVTVARLLRDQNVRVDELVAAL